ncbi:MAG TPA: SPOR domain-containing protein [Balneolaceae bacterium]
MTHSKHLLCFGFLLLLCLSKAEALAPGPADENKGQLIFLQLKIERKLVFSIDARLWKDKLYLPAKQLFSLLKIEASYQKDRLVVHFPDPSEPVQFNFEEQTVEGPEGSIKLSDNDVIRTENEIFIYKKLLEKLLKMEVLFDYRKLQVLLYSEHKLPVVKFRERKERYENFSSASVEFSPDVRLPGKHYLFDGWIADWSLNSTHTYKDFNYSYSLGLGGHFLGGNMVLNASGSKQYGVHWERLKGRWEYSIYSSPLIKKVQLGDLSVQNRLGLNAYAFRGIKVTNRPNAPVYQFGTFHFADRLNEGWDSELYINNQLKDFAVSNRRRFFRFNAPLYYGSNLIQLKYYDPTGFNHSKQYLIYIPRDFLSPGKFQYTLSAGKYSTFADRVFGRLDTRLGVTSNITVGGGSIMQFSDRGKKFLPFVQSWFRLSGGIIAKGSHTFNHLSQASLRMILSGSQSLLINAKKYYESSIYNKTGKSVEAAFNTSFPVDLSFLNFSTFISSRFTRYHSGNQNLNIYSGISMGLPLGMTMRVNNRMMFRDESIKQFIPLQFNTEVHLSRRLFSRLLLRPSLIFSHRLDKITNFGLDFKLRVSSRSYLSFSFHRNELLDNNRFLLSFKIDLPFVRHTSFARALSGEPTFYQNTTGSIIFNNQSRSFLFDDQRQTGKAALVLDAFLDLNNNGERDRGEPSVEGVTADVYRQGQSRPSHREQRIIKNLIPYERYILQINRSSLVNPLWKPKYKSYSVQPLPNLYKTIPVPIVVTGEMSGEIFMNGSISGYELYGLDIKIQSLDESFTKTIKTYTGGNFYYVGLMPGKYEAVLNAEQLAKRSFVAVKDSIQFTVEPAKRGDIVDGISFRVASLNAVPHQPLKELFAIQIGAFREKKNAIGFVNASELKTDHNVTVIFNTEQKLFKCRIGFFKSRKEAEQLLNKLIAKQTDLYQDAFIVRVSLDQSL